MSTESMTPEFGGVGTATLSTAVAETEDGEPFTIHGVALGAGDVTVGQSGERKVWLPEALQEAAETLEGRPLVKNHVNNADGRIGTVTKTAYKPGVGVLYQAEIAPHYEELAKDIEAGILDVSPRIKHPDELEVDEELDAKIVDRMLFDNLSVVATGASPSNTANAGPSPELSPTAGIDASVGAPAIAEASAFDGTEDGFAVATLSRGYDADELGSSELVIETPEAVETEPDTESESDAGEDADEASEDDAGATEEPDEGEESEASEELAEEPTEADDDDEAEELTEAPADVDDESEAVESDDETPVEADPADVDDDVEGESESTDESESETEADTPHDDPEAEAHWASSGAVAALSSPLTTMNPEYTEADEDAIEEMADPVLVERDDVEQLHEMAEKAEKVDERLEELNERVEIVDAVDADALEALSEAENPVVLEADELSEKDDLVAEVGTIYAEELEASSPFTAEELTSRFTPGELREKLVGEDGDVAEELSDVVGEEPEPEGETVESEELSESTEDVEREELEASAREQVAEELESVGWHGQAQKVRDGEMDLEELGVEIDTE